MNVCQRLPISYLMRRNLFINVTAINNKYFSEIKNTVRLFKLPTFDCGYYFWKVFCLFSMLSLLVICSYMLTHVICQRTIFCGNENVGLAIVNRNKKCC